MIPLAFEFEIYQDGNYKVITQYGLSAKATKIVDLLRDAIQASEITGCYDREAVKILIIKMPTGLKKYYYKTCWYTELDWFSSSKRKKLEEKDYIEMDDGYVYPVWWPDDMIDPLHITK
jgi:hypothetical protein